MKTIEVATVFTRHPKALAVGPTARHLYLVSLMWAGEYDTDGDIPAYALPTMANDAGIPVDEVGPVVDRLVEVRAPGCTAGLWERTPDGWRIHDWPDWQPPNEARERKAELNRQRQRRFKARQDELGNALADDDIPPHPPNSLSGSSNKERGGGNGANALPRRRRTQCPDGFAPTMRNEAWAHEKRPDLNLANETERFILYHQAKGNVFIDWQKAWQNWIRGARQGIMQTTRAPGIREYTQSDGSVIRRS